MKVTTLFALASVGSLAAASDSFARNHRRAARSFGSRSLEVRAPFPGSDASTGTYAANSSLEKKDTIHEIAQVAKLAIASYQETVKPVDTTVQAAQQEKDAEAKAAAAKAAAEKQQAEEKAIADAAAANKAAVAKAKAERAAKAEAAAAAQKKKEEEEAAAAAAAAQEAADRKAAKKAKAARKAKAEKVAAAKAASVKVAATKSVKLDKVFSGKGKSLIGFVDSNCGPSGATEEEPNGSESWLNCGLSKSNPDSGWTPPSGVTLDHLTVVTLEEALSRNSVWAACQQYFGLFEQVERETGVPAILLASFALQESTCRHDVAGDNGGAFGLMQITQDKCEGRDKAGCQEPYFNVKTAAAYFMTELNNAGGNVVESTARYNGWIPSLTYNQATRYASDPVNCDWQQNLDYLYQMFNGWVLGRTGYELGSYQNLKVCRH